MTEPTAFLSKKLRTPMVLVPNHPLADNSIYPFTPHEVAIKEIAKFGPPARPKGGEGPEHWKNPLEGDYTLFLIRSIISQNKSKNPCLSL